MTIGSLKFNNEFSSPIAENNSFQINNAFPLKTAENNSFQINNISPCQIAENVDLEQKQLCNNSIFPNNYLGKNNPQVGILA